MVTTKRMLPSDDEYCAPQAIFLVEQFVLAILALNCTYVHRSRASEPGKIRKKQIGTFDP